MYDEYTHIKCTMKIDIWNEAVKMFESIWMLSGMNEMVEMRTRAKIVPKIMWINVLWRQT